MKMMTGLRICSDGLCMRCRGHQEEKAGADGGRVAAQHQTSTGVRSHIYTTEFVGEKTDSVQMYTDHLGYVFLSDGVHKRVKR